MRACERRERRPPPRVSVLRAARDWRVVTPARTRAVSNNARRQRSIDRSMDDASFRHKTTTTTDDENQRRPNERATKRHGSYLREFLDGVSRRVPRVPRHERVDRESSPSVLARSNAAERETGESDRRRGVPPFLHHKAFFIMQLKRVVVVPFLPFFVQRRHFSKRTKTNKQTNTLQTNERTNERRNEQTHQSFENPYEILTRRIRTCVRDK